MVEGKVTFVAILIQWKVTLASSTSEIRIDGVSPSIRIATALSVVTSTLNTLTPTPIIAYKHPLFLLLSVPVFL